jgi:phosphohistidine phosphatase
MLLYLLRHGDVVESGYTDSSRPLSSLGEEQAAVVAGVFVTFHLPLSAILSSPLLRAVRMAEIISEKITGVTCSATEHLAPGMNEKQLFKQLNELGMQAVLLVGHEPHLRRFVSLLLSGSSHAQIEFRKATLMCIECSREVQPEAGTLKWMLNIDQMNRLVAK